MTMPGGKLALSSIALIACFSIAAQPIDHEAPETVTVEIRVTGADGSKQAAAEVLVQSLHGGERFTNSTNSSGKAKFSGIPPGAVVVEVRQTGNGQWDIYRHRHEVSNEDGQVIAVKLSPLPAPPAAQTIGSDDNDIEEIKTETDEAKDHPRRRKDNSEE